MTKKNALIIGATGNVGGRVADYLSNNESLNVVAAARNPETAIDLLPNTVEIRKLDLDDLSTVEAAVQGIDTLLLVTGYTVDMMKQSKRVIDAGKAAGVQHIVHIGASANPTTEIAHWGWHRMIEAYIEKQGFSYTHIHPESYMQNLIGFGWLQGDQLVNLIGDSVWSWVDSEDVALLAANAIAEPERFRNQEWRLGYQASSMADVALEVERSYGTRTHLNPVSPSDFYDGAIAQGADPAYMACIRDQLTFSADGSLEGISETFDSSAFERATGRKPRTWSDFLHTNSSVLKQVD